MWVTLPGESVLQCVAVCCSVLQRVAGYCSMLQCVAVCQCVTQNSNHWSSRSETSHLSVMQGVAQCCSVLQGVAVCCRVLQCVALHGIVLQVLQGVTVCS